MNKKQLVIYLLSCSIIIAINTLLSQYPILPVHPLVFLPYELDIPLMVHAIWPYLCLYFYFFFGIKYLIEHNIQSNFLTNFAILNFLVLSIYLIFPTAYPREFYPIPLVNGLSYNLLTLLRMISPPVALTPSLLILNCALLSRYLPQKNKRLKHVSFAIIFIGSLGGLFIKHYYVLDFLISWIIVLIIFWTFKVKKKAREI